MQSLKQASRGARQGVRSLNRQQPRRWAHDAHDSTHQSPPAPSHESLGRGFYITVGLIPVSLALYKLSGQNTDNSQPYFTRVLNSYDSWRQNWADRNDLHTQAVEQAGRDRNLFLNSPGTRHVDIKFPEALNGGSPWNVPAGHGSANIETVIAKYQKENYEANERKHKALQNNEIKSEKPFQPPGGRFGESIPRPS